uniref:Uncharacterized protein n=1 Tax=Saccharum spontaneum TaxID=62335 RepID=A0A678T4H9_SACSP|nr:hypothetical protein SS91I14_000012 [Saccharum spontaneum]
MSLSVPLLPLSGNWPSGQGVHVCWFAGMQARARAAVGGRAIALAGTLLQPESLYGTSTHWSEAAQPVARMSPRTRTNTDNVFALSCAAADRVQHHSSSRPKVEVFAVKRNVDLAAFGADLSFVVVPLVGGNQPAATPEEFLAHLSSKFHVSVEAATTCAWFDGPIARVCQQHGPPCVDMQGGETQIQAVRREPQLAVDPCLEVQQRDFDPITAVRYGL